MSIYEAAHAQAIWLDHNTRGRLLLTGRDRLDLMNRISTNRLIDIPEGAGRRTLFLNANARIIHSTVVLNRGESVLVVTEPENGTDFDGFLRRNVFWNDQLSIDNVSDSLQHIGIYGPNSTDIVATWWPGAAQLERYQFAMDVGSWLVRVDDIAAAPAYWVMGPPDFIAEVHAHLTTVQVPEATGADYKLLRIEAGLPAAGHELTDAYIPLELGLWDAISFNKGCYTGQEIIARMESRGKLARMLVQIRSEAPLANGDPLTNSNGRQAGTVTSAATHPQSGQTVGLAVVKAADAQVGNTLHNGDTQPVEIIALAGHYEAQYD